MAESNADRTRESSHQQDLERLRRTRRMLEELLEELEHRETRPAPDRTDPASHAA